MLEYNFNLHPVKNLNKNIEVLWVGECGLVERLELELAKYGTKGTGSGGRDSWKHSEGITNCNGLNRGLQIIN